jgi:hypothetical protein
MSTTETPTVMDIGANGSFTGELRKRTSSILYLTTILKWTISVTGTI